MIWEILDDWMVGLDMMISFNGRLVGMHDTMNDIGIGHDCTLRFSGKIRGGVQRFRAATAGHSGTVEVLSMWTGTGVAGQKSLLNVWVPEGS